MKQLVFVYNANSDLFSSVTDFAHKIISPSTYQCNLCALTYGNFTMKQEWQDFIKQLPVKVLFIHKDEFEKSYSVKTKFPAVFIDANNILEEIISAKEINDCKSLVELEKLVEQKLNFLSLTDYTESHR